MPGPETDGAPSPRGSALLSCWPSGQGGRAEHANGAGPRCGDGERLEARGETARGRLASLPDEEGRTGERHRHGCGRGTGIEAAECLVSDWRRGVGVSCEMVCLRGGGAKAEGAQLRLTWARRASWRCHASDSRQAEQQRRRSEQSTRQPDVGDGGSATGPEAWSQCMRPDGIARPD